MMLLAVFLFSLASTVAVVLFATRATAAEKAARTRLRTLSKRRSEEDEEQIELATRSTTRLSDRIGARFANYGFGATLERLILHAGSQTTVGKIVLSCAAAAALVGLVVDHFAGSILIALPSAAVAALLPVGLLRFQRSRRVKKFNEALADSIDLMSRALSAGHSVSSAIEVVAEQSPQPLAGEFEACFQQQKFGIPFREAMLAMGERIPSDDLHFMITAILVQKETGGDLTEILNRTAHLIRERIRIQGEIKTYTAQGRMTGMILSLLPVAMLLILEVINPGYSDVLFHTAMGQKLLGASGVMIVIGGLIIRNIVDIKV